jgi:thymidylate kinase
MGRAPNVYFSRRLRFVWSKFHRYLAPSGAVLAVLGVDGSGKSTVINSIKPILDSATHNATFVHHLRPGLLPPLARLKGKVESPPGPVLDPHGSTPSGIVGSLLRLTWLTLDYILGYWLRIRPIIARQPAIVIFDRYAYDMALDPRRFRLGLPGWVAGLFARLAPRPDLIICLHAAPEVIAQRKQELPLEETRRQLEALLSFAKSQPNAVLISTDGSIEEVRERVLRTLFNFFEKRANHRYKHGLWTA